MYGHQKKRGPAKGTTRAPRKQHQQSISSDGNDEMGSPSSARLSVTKGAGKGRASDIESFISRNETSLFPDGTNVWPRRLSPSKDVLSSFRQLQHTGKMDQEDTSHHYSSDDQRRRRSYESTFTITTGATSIHSPHFTDPFQDSPHDPAQALTLPPHQNQSDRHEQSTMNQANEDTCTDKASMPDILNQPHERIDSKGQEIQQQLWGQACIILIHRPNIFSGFDDAGVNSHLECTNAAGNIFAILEKVNDSLYGMQTIPQSYLYSLFM